MPTPPKTICLMCDRRRHVDDSGLCFGCRAFVDRERKRFDDPALTAAPVQGRERYHVLIPFNHPGI